MSTVGSEYEILMHKVVSYVAPFVVNPLLETFVTFAIEVKRVVLKVLFA